MSHTRRSRGSLSRARTQRLILALGSENGSERLNARKSLVQIGAPAVPFLLHSLKDSESQVRWEAAKALGSISDSSAAPSLVKALMDRNTEVRWLAAEGLITLERAALIPLMQALEKHFGSVWLRQGARHVLNSLEESQLLNDEIMPVLDALRSPGSEFAVPGAAQKALTWLENAGS